MRYMYAHVDANKVCTGIMDLSGPVVRADYIAITSFDASLIGKKWTGSAWIVV